MAQLTAARFRPLLRAQLSRSADGRGTPKAEIKIAKHREMARARVAVARRFATILNRIWVDNTEFRFGREQAANPTIKAITVAVA